MDLAQPDWMKRLGLIFRLTANQASICGSAAVAGQSSRWTMRQTVVALIVTMIAINALISVGGRSRVPSAPTLSTGGLHSKLPYGYSHKSPIDSIENDMGGAFNASYNYDRYLGASLREGIVPLWDPHLGFGMPHLGNGLSGVLYPLNWLHAVIPGRYSDIILFMNWALAAIFLTLYLRLLGLEGHAPLFGGTMILASGWFSGWLGLREITGVAAWFPLLLYAIERTIVESNWRWRHPLLAVGTFCSITAGHPEAFIPGFMALTAYGVLRLAEQPSSRIKHLVNLAFGAVAGICLAAPMWLTFIETIGYSHHPHQTWASAAGYLSVNAIGFGNFLFPMMLGNIHQFSFAGITGGELTSPGWLPPCAGFFVLCSLRGARRRLTCFFLALFALVALKIWNAPGIQSIALLPGLNEVIWPRYAAYLLAFSTAILAAFGYEHLQRRPGDFPKMLNLWSALVAALAILFAILIARAEVGQHDWALVALLCGVIWAVAPLVGLRVLRARGADGWKQAAVAFAGLILPATAYNAGGFPWELALALSGIYLLILTLFSNLISPTAFRSPSAALLLLAVLTMVPILIFAKQVNSGPPRRYDVLTPPPYMQALQTLQQGGLYRAMSFDAAPMPNVQTALALPGFGWIVPLLPNNFHLFYRRFFDTNLPTPNWYAANVSMLPPGPSSSIDELHRNIRFYSMAGMRFLTTQYSPVMQGSATSLVQVRAPDATTTSVIENTAAQPRLFLATDIRKVDSPEAAWSALADFQDPKRQIAVEGDVPAVPPCAAPALGIAAFRVLPNTVTASIDANCAGVLVLSDTLLPGWRASLNGVAEPIVRVDGFFRGVSLPNPGHYEVAFSYRPATWPIAVTFLTVGLVLLAGTVLARFFTKRIAPSA
jgi:hypothetical protein